MATHQRGPQAGTAIGAVLVLVLAFLAVRIVEAKLCPPVVAPPIRQEVHS